MCGWILKQEPRTSLKSWPNSCIHLRSKWRVLAAEKSPASRSCSSVSAAALPPCGGAHGEGGDGALADGPCPQP